MSDLLDIQGLTTGIGATGPEILSDVSLTVRAGEVLGVVGESGSGKSMLALSLMGLLPPPIQMRGGALRMNGIDLAALSEPERRAKRGGEMAMIFQEPMTALNPLMRVGQQIGEVLRWRLGLSKQAARDRAVELLAQVEIPDPQRRVDAYAHELSGGMRQRVMIAMALAGKPRLLIADEPTTALDVTIQAQILELLRDLQRAQGIGVLLITHDLGVIAEMCDRVAVMYAGRVVETGPSRTLFDQPAHPYSLGLLGSRPRLHGETSRLTTIEGQVPAVGQFPSGCRFAPRCARATSACAELPPLRQVGATHEAACFHVLETAS